MTTQQDMCVPQQTLDFYTRAAAITTAGRYAPSIEALPNDIDALARVVQGLAIHEYMASAYGVAIPDERRSESHIRPVERMLERLLSLDGRPLSNVRPPEKRLVGVCRHFSSLIVAMLRTKGIPARARYGFGSYFNPGYFEEHIVCEYWNAAEARWVLVDAQFDDLWIAKLKIDHDVRDVPRDRFLVAGDAWVRCRSGAADPSTFGILVGELRGLWFIAGELVRDLAALNKMEMLPWDVWGAMPKPNEQLTDEQQLALFDRLATLTRAPDASFTELRRVYETDDRLRVPASVLNWVLNRSEAV